MILSKVILNGYRNYKNATINFNPKTLIIGGNDVGKTNLLWAMRLLLDRTLSDFDIEPKDSDFFVHEETNVFSIILCFTEVTEDCIVSKLKGKISDNDELFISYKAQRDKITRKKSYQLYAGYSLEKMEEIEDRYYRRVLNIKYISGRRDFQNYINREKSNLIQQAKENRTPEEVSKDDILYKEIKDDLTSVDNKIPNLNFINSSTKLINEELTKLSEHHKNQKVVFDTKSSDIDSFINNINLASQSNNKNVIIGGDGRLNQIYLSLWVSRNELNKEKIDEVSIFCIEEPEAHLHPHQQRKLAEYLASSISGQVIITSHSPQIASEFSPNSIIRLYSTNGDTTAASNGCSEIIDEAFIDFGYRLSIIPAEAFFSDVVFLVEGPSEEMFYKTLAKQLDIDLDRLNISILLVDGIGFSTYINILNRLNIQWVLRTDNDVFKIPNKDEYRFAGIQRCLEYYKDYFKKDDDTEELLKHHGKKLTGFASIEPPQANIDAANLFVADLKLYKMFLANVDLENDLVNSAINPDLKSFFNDLENEDEIVDAMQKRKATFMFDFLKNKKDVLKKLTSHGISEPLYECKKIVEQINA